MSRTCPGLEIVAVDPHDEQALTAWYDAYAEAERHGRGRTATVWQLRELQVMLAEPSIRRRSTAWAGRVDGRTVAAGWVQLPLLDNLERAELSVQVVPAARRRGHGTAMLAHLEQVAREEGRTVLGAEATYDYDAGPDGAGESGPEFARARGFDLVLGDVQRILDLPVPDEVLDRLAAEAAPHHTAYTLRSWVGPVPEELLVGWADLTSSLMTEAPMGELDVERESASTEAVRDAEALVAKQGRTKYNTVALDAEGTVVAYTDLATTVHEPGRAYQWGTLVRREHRGHRLGLAVKVANLRLLQAECPDLDHVVTYNAEVNAHMVAVNDALGYRVTARLGEFQKRLA
ncbi:GNAT family N-acetyltransferase [Nocardioides sp. zg-DK7169]|uniref:GNAT family N-acetyltransferase n=1 Tax=Nocardioides sp. zg-DK7169 TaxID=2736600 RepID=UPI0015565BD9|nr:GNAT family N-acetyltransferase [Nocardioides sp. zg-DK7169]NPC97484.1 GNAT family N-acetyltransferase [Nocardioides sp. zg-DK7169]